MRLSSDPSTTSQGARLFLNALFEADCVTTVGQPGLSLTLDGPLVVAARSLPVDATYGARFDNAGAGAALAAELRQRVGAGVEIVSATGGTIAGDLATWQIGSISGVPLRAGDPPTSDSRASTLRFAAYGDYTVTLELAYQVGASMRAISPVTFSVHVTSDRDGDGVPDELDPFPDDPDRCGDSDDDTCDDCSNGPVNPRNDGPDADHWDDYLERYDTGRLAAALGNTPEADGDGVLYAGQGDVQLTGRANYAWAEKATGFPLLAKPELMLDPAISAAVLVKGLSEGAFTGRKLRDYLPLSDPASAGQFYDCRRTVNALDRAADIAGYALSFQAALAIGGWL